MINQNYEVYASFVFYFLTKLLCYFYEYYQMHGKRQLTSIPERNEMEDEIKSMKWVPKKKHEVLKAKYKCLKKLFQIYDASVIGILPDPYAQDEIPDDMKCRKKRSHRTKTDACAGTTELSSGDASDLEEKSTIATAVIRDLKIQCSCSTQIISTQSMNTDTDTEKYATQKHLGNCTSQDSKQTIITSDQECECSRPLDNNLSYGNGNNVTFDNNIRFENGCQPHPIYLRNEKRKLTRFQSFMQRILGIKPEKSYRNYVLPNGHVYAASDNNITLHHNVGRRRRRLRFRRLRRPKKINSEGSLRDLRSPIILTCVQSVQKSCLMDTTPRQCPIVGCKMMFYGIINYNDHLNLCHFTERKYVCHYCHEGFEREYDKYVHENDHIGITKLNLSNMSATSTTRQQSDKKVCNTQTEPGLDVPEEKLKKIVSFFDKFVENEQMITEIKKNRNSESNLYSSRRTNASESVTATDTDDTATNCSSHKRTVSCGNLRKTDKSKNTIAVSEMTSKCACAPVKCHICGEHFDFRRQLSLHVDLEHRVHDKFSKFHSCAGIINTKPKRTDLQTTTSGDQDESTDLEQSPSPSSTLTDRSQDTVIKKSTGTLSCDPSTNIIYYESTDSLTKKQSVMTNIVQKVRSGITNYKWEPGTKIIRV